MGDIPDHIGVKIRRAQQHLEEAKALSDGVLNQYLHAVKVQFDRNGRRHTYRVGAVQQLPPLLNVLLGETAFQLRSTLDHLAFALVKPTGKQIAKVQFPIVWQSKHFRDTASRMLPGVPTPLRAVIERLQPYHRRRLPNSLLLGQLQEINNWDKHRLILAVAVSMDFSAMRFLRSDGKVAAIARQKIFNGALKPNAIIARVEYADDPTTSPQMKMQTELTSRIVFDRAMPKVLVNRDVFMVLDNAGRFIVEGVLPVVKPFF